MAFSAKAQVQKLQDLEVFIHQNITQVSNSLVEQGWKLNATLTGNNEEDYYRTFSFGNSADDGNKALAWIRIHSTGTPVNRVYFQAPDQETFHLLVKELDMRKISKSAPQHIEGQSLTAYIGPDFAYQAILSDQSYTLVVIAKKFYETHAAPAP